MFKKVQLIIALTMILIMILGLQVQAEKFEVTIEDDLEQEITLNEKPEQIISLAPSHTEMLFALGLGEKIVGVTQSANYPEEVLEYEKIGQITEPNIEKIVSLEPDLVIAAAVNKKETVEKLRDLDIKVAGFAPNSVQKTLETMEKVGQLTGEESKVQEIVNKMENKLNKIKNLVDSHLENHERKKVFYEIWSDPLMTAGANTFINDLIEIAGGINLGAEAQGDWPQYNMESLLTENPEVYISTPHSAQEEVTVESIQNRDKFETIKAIKEGNIHVVNQDIVNRPSPRIIKGLKIFVKAIHPELTTEIEEIEDIEDIE